jgi:hypothetical protein
MGQPTEMMHRKIAAFSANDRRKPCRVQSDARKELPGASLRGRQIVTYFQVFWEPFPTCG